MMDKKLIAISVFFVSCTTKAEKNGKNLYFFIIFLSAVLLPSLVTATQENYKGRIRELMSSSQQLSLAHDTAKTLAPLHLALKIALANNDPKQTAVIWKAIGNIHAENANYAVAEKCYLEGLKYLKSQNKNITKSKLYFNLSLLNIGKGSYNEALVYANQAHEIIPSDSIHLKADVYQIIGTSYYLLGRYDYALNYYYKSLALNEEIKNLHAKSEIANEIGRTYARLKHYQKAISYYHKSYRWSRAVYNDVLQASVLQNIGNLYLVKKENDSAFHYISKAYEIFRKNNDVNQQINALREMGMLYSTKGEDMLAENTLKKALAMAYQINDPYQIACCRSNLGQIYFKKQNYRLAIFHLEEALVTSDSIKSYDVLQLVSYHLANSYSKIGNYDKAYRYLDRYRELKDSLDERSKRDTINKIEFHYRQESQLRQAKIDQLEYEKKWQQIILGITVFIVILGAVHWFYKRRQLHQQRVFQATLSSILGNIREGILGLDSNGTVLYFNPNFQDYINIDAIAVNQPLQWDEIFKHDITLRKVFIEKIQKARQGVLSQHSYQLMLEDEQKHFYEAEFNPIQWDQNTSGVVVVIRDVTAEEENRVWLNRFQRSILEWTIAGQEEERKRIAHDLHDGLAQIISAVAMQLEVLRYDVSHLLSFDQIEILERVVLYAQDATEELRAIAYNLSPHELQESGLVRSLETLCSRIGYVFPLQVEFFTNVDNRLLIPEPLSLSYYRIAQEALNNVAKHAHANSVQVDLLIQENEKLILMISDDGIGFNTPKEGSGGMGLKTIKSRVELMGGQLSLISDQSGTIIRVEVNLISESDQPTK